MSADISASNVVIHVIDSVLLPKMTPNPGALESFFKAMTPVNRLDEAVDTLLHVDVPGLRVGFTPMGLMGEPRVRTHGEGCWAFLRHVMRLRFLNLAAVWVFFRDRHRPDSAWGCDRNGLIRPIDHRILDGAFASCWKTA